jgi:hypothetical protein
MACAETTGAVKAAAARRTDARERDTRWEAAIERWNTEEQGKPRTFTFIDCLSALLARLMESIGHSPLPKGMDQQREWGRRANGRGKNSLQNARGIRKNRCTAFPKAGQ